VVVTVPVPGAMGIRIVFDQFMDGGQIPVVGTFTLTSDGAPLVVTPTNWANPTSLDCTTTGTPPVVSGYIRQNVLDPLCYSIPGAFARPQADLQWFP
jgi:hypothetical protein